MLSDARPDAARRSLARWWLNGLMILADLVAIVAAFALAGLAYEGIWLESRAMMQGMLMTALYCGLAGINGSWSYTALLRWHSAVGRMLVALLLAAAMLNLVAFFLKANADFSRGTFAIAIILASGAMAVSRPILSRLARHRFGETLLRTLVIDAGGPSAPRTGDTRMHAAALGAVERLDDPEVMRRLAVETAGYDRVVVTCPTRSHPAWAAALRSLGVRAEIIDDRIAQMGAVGIGSYGAGKISTFVVDAGPMGRRARALKRCFDLLVATMLLIPALPLMAAIAIAIRLDDGGAPMFRQQRIGKANRPFTILKFRTMSAVQSLGRNGPQIMQVTKFGAFLRRTSLDELPQLFNVLRGDMSIVGPRPHTAQSVAGDRLFWDIDPNYWSRHNLRPGMTGLAQVRGHRGPTDHERDLTDRLRADLQYVAEWSLSRDIAILFATLRVVVHEKAL